MVDSDNVDDYDDGDDDGCQMDDRRHHRKCQKHRAKRTVHSCFAQGDGNSPKGHLGSVWASMLACTRTMARTMKRSMKNQKTGTRVMEFHPTSWRRSCLAAGRDDGGSTVLASKSMCLASQRFLEMETAAA